MAFRPKSPLPFFLFLSIFLFSVTLALSSGEDPKLQKCKQACQQKPHFDEGMRRQCERRCEEDFRREGNPQREEQEGEEERAGRNPYFFGRESFRYQVRTPHGHFKTLRKFHEQSELLLGIANYRLAILEANPQTFVMPAHLDAESVCYVIQGRGILSLLREDDRETQKIRQGDIVRVPAGTITYLINNDKSEKLVVAKLLQSVSIPTDIEIFYGASGQQPESFFRSFSSEVLEAAFNTPRDRLEKLFEKQSKGAIIKVSEEQMREIGQHEGGGRWPFGESSRTFNLLDKRPTYSNERGKLYEADANDYQDLRDPDIRVSFANISGGSMIAPFYNTKSTKIALVTEGTGYVEMVCPHLAKQGREQEQEQRGQRYQRVRSQVTPYTVFVIPPGHPAVEVASHGNQMEAICFEIRAQDNQKIFLAGQNHIWKQMEKAAKELAFDMPSKEVDQVLNAQRERVFLPSPEEHKRDHRPLASIFDFAGF